METNINKPKFERTTQEQLLFYIEFCRQHPQLLAGKNSPRSPASVQDLWREIAANLNAMRGPTRTPDKWKENLGVWKNQLRARARKKKSEQQLTGGGPCSSRMLTEFENRALSTFGTAAVEGVPGITTLGMQGASQSPTRFGDGSPVAINVSSPSAVLFRPISPAATHMAIDAPSISAAIGAWSGSPAAENSEGSSPATIGSPAAVSQEASSSPLSLGHSSPTAVAQVRYPPAMSQHDMFVAVMRSIERRDAREEQILQVSLATLQALEKLATAIERISK